MGFNRGFVVIVMMILSGIIAAFFLYEPQEIQGTITGRQLESLLKYEYPKAYVIVLDEKYTLINTTEMQDILKADKTNLLPYVNETFDCDDFAFTLWRNIRNEHGNLAVGVVRVNIDSTAGHVMNFYVDGNLSIHFIEPQTDEIDPNKHITEYTWFLI